MVDFRGESEEPVRELRLSDRVMRDARRIEGADDVLDADVWGSSWLGDAWAMGRLSESGRPSRGYAWR